MSRPFTKSVGSALAVLLVAAAGCSGSGRDAAGSGAAPGTERILRARQPIAGQYLVQLVPATAAADVPAVAAGLAGGSGGTVLQVFTHATKGFAVRASAAGAGAIALDPRVARVEEDAVARAAAVVNAAAGSWGIDRVDQQGPTLDHLYSWDDRWAGQGVDLFVLDTGVSVSHYAFGGRASFAYDALGKGFTGDCSGHGTHVAATAAGAGYGIARQASVRSVRVLDCNGNGAVSDVVAGLDWVIAHRTAPSVANLSLFSGASATLDDAVEAAVGAGIVVVAAAGDGGKDACDVSPARTPGAIAVAATQQHPPAVAGGAPTDALAPFSSTGDCVDLLAPGVEIVSAWNTGPLADLPLSGTSMAAPHVAGAAALQLSREPGATPQAVARALVAASTRAPAAAPDFTPDRLLYVRGVEFTPTADDAAPTVSISSPSAGGTLTGTVTVTGTGADDYGLTRVELLVDGRWRGSSATGAVAIAWDTSTSLDGAHTLVLRAYDQTGHATDSAPVAVTLANPGVAHLDGALRIARCETLAASCDSRELVKGRAGLGPERYAPSALRDPCETDPAGCVCDDGELGLYLVDESVERLRVESADGLSLATGKNVRIDVDVIAGAGQGDQLDLYSSPTATPTAWRHLITLSPAASGPQTLSAWATLPAGATQAIRAAFRRGGEAATCTAGGYDERDDLAFEVGAGSVDATPPTVAILAPAAKAVLSGPTTVKVSAQDDRLVAKVMLTAEDALGKSWSLAQLTSSSPWDVPWNPALLPNGAYSLKAEAHDGAGNTAVDRVDVTLADLEGPVSTIVAPLDGAVLPANVVAVSATATDAGAVKKVELLVDGVYQGADTAEPWAFEWRAAANGTYALRVRGTDLQGNVAESPPVTVKVDDVVPPEVKVLSPADLAVVPNSVTFAVAPTDASGIVKVEFFLDGASLGSTAAAPWEVVHDFSRSPNGNYVLSASATDGVGNVGTGSVTVKRNDLVKPTVSVTYPTPYSVLTGEVLLTADASDDSAVQRVEFWVQKPDTTFTLKLGEAAQSPWELRWASNTIPPGVWWLYAIAYDYAGNWGVPAMPTVVGVGDYTPPTTALVAPVAGLLKVSGSIRVAAEAADPGGQLSKVELLVDDVPFATFTAFAAMPLEAMLDTTTVANGDRVLTSKAYDKAGHTTVSAPVTLNVLNPGAVHDPVVGAPVCDAVSSSCHTGILVMGRGPLGPELHASNTVDGCPDGDVGTYGIDESIEHVAISSLDGTHLTGGRLARVDARVVVADPLYDRLDVYVAASPTAPQFVLRATVVPTTAGEQTLTAVVPLAYSTRQVVRVALRGGGTAEACGATGYDDRDDVVVATLPGTPDTTPPVVAVTMPGPGASVRGDVTVAATATDDVGVERVELAVDGVTFATLGSPPYSATWATGSLAPGAYTLTATAYDYSGNWATSAPVAVTVVDQVAPTTAITAPVDGETLAGAVTVQATAADNVGVTQVQLFRIDAAGVETLVATATAPPWSFPTSVVALQDGADYRFVTRARDAGGNVGASAPITVHVALSGLASFDKKMKVARCALPGASCWTGGLVVGRGPLGPEPSAPNTIGAGCPDGATGFFHLDESADVIAVRAVDRAAGLKENGAVRIEVKIWATASFGTDQLDLYVAQDAAAPVWSFVKTLAPTRAGAQVLGVDHVLGVGPLQAVRAQLRHGGGAATTACSAGEYDDHDDLVFAVTK